MTPRTPYNLNCFSPEPIHNFKNELSKSVSAIQLKSMTKDIFSFAPSNVQEYSMPKNVNDVNVQLNSIPHTNEQSSSSASGISSPSNTSNNSHREDDEK